MAHQRLRYYFDYIEHCKMCDASLEMQKVLGKRLNASQGKKPSTKTGVTTTVCRCHNCGLIYANPQPIPFDLQDHYGIPADSYWKPEHFVVSDDWFHREIATLQTLLPFEKGMKALDIGAGLGKTMLALEKIGFESYGFEPSSPFLQRAIEVMKISPERLQSGAIENINYPDAHFDFISFGAVLEHLYDPSDSIQRAMRWLKPGGIIYIDVPSADWLISKLGNAFYKAIGTDYVTNISPMHSPFHLYEFTLRSFEANARVHGYSVVKHQYNVGSTYMPSWMNWLVIPFMRKFKKGMQLTVWLKKN